MNPNTVESIYDVPLKSWDGREDFLSQYKGKVTLIVNVTANCGNAPQLAPLEEIYQKYKDRGFAIAAIPTNDYCGPGVTYDKWENGITCADDARTYALDTYQVTYDFSEMIVSLVDDVWRKKRDNYKPTHPLYEALTNGRMAMGGNFEKYLVDKDGYVDRHFQCTTLNYDVEKTLKDKLNEDGIDPGPGFGRSRKIFEEEWDVICGFIEQLIAGNKAMINPNN